MIMSKIEEQPDSINAPIYTDPGKTVTENIVRLQKAKSDIRKWYSQMVSVGHWGLLFYTGNDRGYGFIISTEVDMDNHTVMNIDVP